MFQNGSILQKYLHQFIYKITNQNTESICLQKIYKKIKIQETRQS